MSKRTSSDLIVDALTVLVRQKSFDKITVKDILNISGVSRSTFYRHFKDIYDLATWSFEKFIQEWIQRYEAGDTTWQEVVYQVVKYFDYYRDHFAKMPIRLDANWPAQSLIKYAKDEFYTFVCKNNNDFLSPELKFEIDQQVYGSFLALLEWTMQPVSLSPDEVTKCICGAMPTQLKAILG